MGSEPEAKRCVKGPADKLTGLLGVEAGRVHAGDRHALPDRVPRPGSGRERNGRGEDEQEQERPALPERHADDRGCSVFHEPDVTTKTPRPRPYAGD